MKTNRNEIATIRPCDAILHNFVTQGDIGAIQEYAAELAQSDQQYQPFAAELQHLAESFQMQKLQSWLESYFS